MIWPQENSTQVSLFCLNRPTIEGNCFFVYSHRKAVQQAFSLCHPACALLQPPTFLVLLLLPAWVANVLGRLYKIGQHTGCLWETRHFPICRGLQLEQLSISCTVYGCILQGSSTDARRRAKHSVEQSREFCPYLVKRAWTHVELMSSTGCIANSHGHLPSFI